MKHETFLRNCRVSKLIYNTCWLVNRVRLYIWAVKNIKPCEQRWEHTQELYPLEIVQRDCIVALIKHSMRQALKNKHHTYRHGPLVVTYEPERYLEFEFDYDSTECAYVYIHTKIGVDNGR